MLNIYQDFTILCNELQLPYMQWHIGWFGSFEVPGLEITVGHWTLTNRDPTLPNGNFYTSDSELQEEEKGSFHVKWTKISKVWT